jgi:hypothetical protein
MKKRKSPILLVSVLVILLIVVAGMSGAFAPLQGGGGHDHQGHAHDSEMDVTGQPRQADSEESVGAALDSVVTEGGGGPMPLNPPDAPGNQRPAVLKDDQVYRPTPPVVGETVGGQWYTDQAAKPKSKN